jgi:tRNA-dihydrouridine synthase B
VQIAGYDPQMMAEAAQFNVAQGAEIIDINMGCPAKKVCKRAAGSALLRDPELVARILSAVVNAVEVPVTLKIRTGWDRQNRNASEIAKIAEQSGIQALAVHGRTKACRFVGEVEYDSIAEVVDTISIPVFANGDITSAAQAQTVLKKTGASAVMIGRGAQGNPWIFNQINHYLEHGELLAEPSLEEVGKVMTKHLADLHEFYGEVGGVRISRKHIGWYSRWLDDGKAFTKIFNQHETRLQQQQQLSEFFSKYPSQEQAA